MGHFRVRRLARQEIDGREQEVELLYPSMYFAVEAHRNGHGRARPETACAVNNIYLNGVRIAAALPDGQARYYLTDQVDSVKVVTDDRGLVLTSHEYLPFGESWITEGDEKNAPKYNSQELDKESGYYFYNARHYYPEIARFVTPDTVIDGELSTQGWNRFAYVHNNPIRYKDPTGHVVETLWDIANIGLGVYNVYDAITDKKQDKVDVALAVGGLVADTAAALIPIVPGGVSTAIKLTKEGVDVAGAAKKGYDVYKKDYDVKGDRKSAILKGAAVAGGDILANKALDQLAKPLVKLSPSIKKEYNKYSSLIKDTFDTKNMRQMFKTNIYEKGLKDLDKSDLVENASRSLSNVLQKGKNFAMEQLLGK